MDNGLTSSESLDESACRVEKLSVQMTMVLL